MRKICCLLASLTLLAVASGQTPAARTVFAIPQGFEPNLGQSLPGVDFTSHGPGYTLSLAGGSASLQLVTASADQQATLRMTLAGADSKAAVEGVNRQVGKSNYFLGNDPKTWLTDIPQYGRVEYRGVYPGIDVAYYGNNERLEYDFMVAAHADPSRIRLAVDGADKIQIDPAGDLVLTVGSAQIRERKPVVYQETANGRRVVEGRYTLLNGNAVGFALGSYDATAPLVIDPVLVFSTFFGSSGTDQAQGVTLDSNGTIYMCGNVGAGSFHGTNIGNPSFAGANVAAFVAKVSPGGTLISSTFIAGTNDVATGTGIALDTNGNIYLTGNTSSATFPNLNAVQKTYGGGGDGYALELNNAGNALVYSTYLGGSSADATYGIGVDSFGNALVTGWTASKNFPVANATQSTLAGGENAFVVKIASGGGSLVYSTYYGGSGGDFGEGLAIDESGNLFFFGNTSSTNFPVLNAYQPHFCGWSPGQGVSNPHGFVTKFSPTGVPLFSTYLCGSASQDGVRAGATDAEGDVIVVGFTGSATFPTLSPLQASFAGGAYDAFVTKFGPSGTLLFSTYLGGSGSDVARGITVDQLGNIYVTGNTASPNFPTLNPTQKNNAGADDAFLTKYNAATSAMVFSTYLGGGGEDYGDAVAVDGFANAYIVGSTASANFPISSALQSTYGGGASDGFLSVLSTCAFSFSTSPTFSIAGGTGSTTITTTPECGWAATSNSAWITVTSSPATGQGSGSVSYSVAANSGSARTGSLSIGGQTVSIPQYGVPVLTLTETNSAGFTQGENGAIYTATMGAAAGSGPTAGTVTLTQTLPTGLTLVSMAGNGWACTGATCTRSDVLAAGSTYPAVTVTVNVAANAGTPLLAQVTASGGGALSQAMASDNTTIASGATPVLNVTETNAASFTEGQAGATYSVTVSANASGGPTAGTVTLVQALPAGLSLVSMAGSGWACTGATCTRSDVLAAGASYPAVTVTVNVAANAGTPLLAQVTVSGGGSANANGSDSTVVIPVPALSVTETNSAGFTQGENGAVYTVVVSNGAGVGPTSGTLTLTQTLPTGLTLVSMSGAGWACNGASCTRSDALASGASYPAVTVTVNVAANAGSPLLAQATASGGGSAAPVTGSDNTVISAAATPALSVALTSAASFALGQWNVPYTITVANGSGAGATSGTVTLTETLPSSLTLVSMAGSGWACSGAVCTRSDALAGGASYPAVTAVVNVSLNAPASVTNQATASGGGSAPATGTDVTTISPQNTAVFTLTNQGPSAVMWAGLTLAGESYTDNVQQTTNCPVTIGVNTSCTVNLAFNAPGLVYPADWADYSMYAASDQSLEAGAPNPTRLVLIGDSITYYWDQPSPYGEGSLQAVQPFVNRGIGGQTTQQMLVRFWEDVVKLNPKAVQIFGGTNDLGGNTGPETNAEIMDQLTSMTMIAQANGIKVLLASITPTVDLPGHIWSDRRPAATVIALNQSIKALCSQTGAIYVDYYSALVDPSTGAMNVNLTVDGLHPNTQGFALMVPVAQAALSQLGYAAGH